MLVVQGSWPTMRTFTDLGGSESPQTSLGGKIPCQPRPKRAAEHPARGICLLPAPVHVPMKGHHSIHF